jgi:polyisoprenoid-binding protein YceI
MLKKLVFLFAALLPLSSAYADKYEFDKEHTYIIFYINHLGYSESMGKFTEYSGGFTFDEKAPEKSSIDVTLKPSGIRTSSETLDKKLQNDQFFNTEKFPDIRFKSTSIKITGKNTSDITGDLTMLGVTKPVVLKTRFNKADYHPFTKMYVAGFNATTTIKRSDFGMNYSIPMVGDEVRLDISTEGVNLDRKQAESIKK